MDSECRGCCAGEVDRVRLAAIDVATGCYGDGCHGVGDESGAGDGVAGAVGDFENVIIGAGGVEDGGRQGDLVVLKVVDDVCGAEESVAEHGCAASGGSNTEDADGLTAVDACYDDQLVELHADGGAGEGEVDAAFSVAEGTIDEGCALLFAILGVDGVEDGRGDGVRKVHQTAARVKEDGDGLALCDVVLFAVGSDVCQGDNELGIHTILGDDWEGVKLALELGRVDTTKQN